MKKKSKTVMVRVRKELKKKLKIKAAQEEVTMAELLDKLLEDI